jgi:outer membrane protein
MKIMRRALSVMALLMSFSASGFTAETVEPEILNVVGGGVYIRETAYEGIDAQVFPIPVLKWRNEKFFVDGLKGGYILYEENNVRLDVVLAPRLMGYDADDSNALAGMENRNTSFDAGMQLIYVIPELKDLNVTVAFLSDVINEYKGQEGEIRISKKFEGSFYQLIPALSAVWQSNDLVDYYYGVRTNETRASRPEYEGDSTFNYVASLGFNMGLSHDRDIFLVTRLDATILGEEIKKSPIVKKNVTLGGLVSVVFKF